YGVISNKTDLRLRYVWPARVCRLSFERALCRHSQVHSHSYLHPDSSADSEHRDVCGGSSVSVDGITGGNARPHVSRITSESHLRRARTPRLQQLRDSQIDNMCG